MDLDRLENAKRLCDEDYNCHGIARKQTCNDCSMQSLQLCYSREAIEKQGWRTIWREDGILLFLDNDLHNIRIRQLSIIKHRIKYLFFSILRFKTIKILSIIVIIQLDRIVPGTLGHLGAAAKVNVVPEVQIQNVANVVKQDPEINILRKEESHAQVNRMRKRFARALNIAMVSS